MAENLEEKTDTKEGERIILRIFGPPLILLTLYISGYAAHGMAYNTLVYPEEYINLNKRKTELVKKVDEWQRFIPLMSKQFASQYQDSLKNVIGEIDKINPELAKIKSKHKKISDKTKYSWVGFFK